MEDACAVTASSAYRLGVRRVFFFSSDNGACSIQARAAFSSTRIQFRAMFSS